MTVQFDESFEKSIKGITDKKLKNRLIDLIASIEESETLTEIPNVKKLRGFKSFYRIRLGSYRVGFELLNDDTVLFILVAYRKDIYRIFP